MKNFKSKSLAVLLALVMMVGVFAPSMARAEQGQGTVTGTLSKDQLQETRPSETTLNIYKLTTQESFSKNAPWDHNGGLINDLEQLGTSVDYLDGIKFKVYKIKGTDKDAETLLNKYKANPSNYKTVAQMDALTNEVEVATGTGLTNGETKKTGETGTKGLTSVTLPNGYYWIVESDTSGAEKPVVGQIAVPFGITLPLMNSVDVEDVKAGTWYLKTVNVYPKNTQTDKPKIDKNFAKYDESTGKWKDKDGNDVNADDLGAAYKNYLETKKTVSAELGKVIPYNVKTELPRNYKFDTISWSDIMSEGLTYNKDLNTEGNGTAKIKVTYKETAEATQTTTAEYVIDGNNGKLTETDFGFDLSITKDQATNTIVKWLENGPVTFELNYSATVNKNTVVDKPQNNDITFKPGTPNPGGSVTPANGEVTVTKTWANKDKGTEPKAKTVAYYLIADGKVVASVTLDKNSTGTIKAGNGIDFVVGANWYSGKFTGLENGKTYTIKEAVDGYEPTFNGANITNTENPDVLKPTEPKVEYHGKKFVKADNLNDARLAGAEFVVYKKVGEDKKYLVAKTGTEMANAQKKVTDAKKALDTAIETYNKLTAQQQTEQEKKKVNDAQEAYNKAVKEASNKYEWGDKANAITLVSDAQGRFEITGLEAGTYYLEETKAPAGYAKNAEDIEFTVKEGSYKGTAQEMQYDEANADNGYGQKVVNKKVTIPQTGGIGTILFTVIGAGLMGGAVFAMKKKDKEEEEDDEE